jgi:hypothetical protein
MKRRENLNLCCQQGSLVIVLNQLSFDSFLYENNEPQVGYTKLLGFLQHKSK